MTPDADYSLVAGVASAAAVTLCRTRPLALFALLLASILVGPVGLVTISGKTAPILCVDVYLSAWSVIAMVAPSGPRRMPRHVSIAVLALLAFLAVAFLSTALLSPDLVKSTYTFKNYVQAVLALYLLGTSVRTWASVRAAVICLYVFGAALAILTAVTSAKTMAGAFWNTLASDKNAAHTAFGQSNYLAGLIILVMPLAIAAAGHSGREAIIAAISAHIMLLGLFIAASRGAFLALTAGVIIAFCYRPKRMAIGLLVATVCAMSALTIVPEKFSSLLEERFYNLDSDRNTRERLALWTTSWRVFSANPVLGVGLKSSGFEYTAHADVTLHTDAHNFLLTLLCETGLLGTSFYLIAMVACCKSGYMAFKDRSQRKHQIFIFGLLLGTAVSTLHSLVEILHGAPEYSILAWAILGVLAASNDIKAPERPSCAALSHRSHAAWCMCPAHRIYSRVPGPRQSASPAAVET